MTINKPSRNAIKFLQAKAEGRDYRASHKTIDEVLEKGLAFFKGLGSVDHSIGERPAWHLTDAGKAAIA